MISSLPNKKYKQIQGGEDHQIETILFSELERLKQTVNEGDPIGTRRIVAVIEERLRGMKDALRLQAIEYERRLEALNGEAARLMTMRNEFVPREVFDKSVSDVLKKYDTAMQAFNDELHEMKVTNKDNVTIRALWVVSVALAGMILSVVKFFIHP